MKIKFKDGEVIHYRHAKDAHDDLVHRSECTCHCQSCSEFDPYECLESTLEQCYEGSEIIEEKV